MSGQRAGQMKGHRIGYKRCSTLEQNTARQLDGIAVDKMFEDHASGKDTKRPQLQLALSFLREGDTLVVHSMDRLSRSLADLLQMVKELTDKGVAIEFIKENMTFNGEDKPIATLLLSVMGACAAFERAILLERQREIQRSRYANHIGEVMEAAVEGYNTQRGQVNGRSSQNKTVNFTTPHPIQPAPGSYVPVRITQSFPNSLVGEAIA